MFVMGVDDKKRHQHRDIILSPTSESIYSESGRPTGFSWNSKSNIDS